MAQAVEQAQGSEFKCQYCQKQRKKQCYINHLSETHYIIFICVIYTKFWHKSFSELISLRTK
jgi:hypothetical protein